MRLAELARTFLVLGSTSFGGPAAHVAAMERVCVREKGWLTREQLLDLYAATQFIPGPNSSETAMHVGYVRAGWRGLLVAGACFIAPAVALAALLGWAYVTFDEHPLGRGALWAVKPVILALMADAIVALARPAWPSPIRLLALVIAAVLTALGVPELVVLFGVAAAFAAAAGGAARAAVVGAVLPALTSAPVSAPSAGAIGAAFAKIGCVLFGSGYVLVAFLRAEFVRTRGWLTDAQLLDVVAAGQVMPGPVFSSATFAGWVMGGGAGAVAATVGIFAPAFLFAGLTAPWVGHLTAASGWRPLLDGLTLATIGMAAAAGASLAPGAFPDPPTVAIGVVALAVRLRWAVNGVWLVLAAAIVGAVAQAVR